MNRIVGWDAARNTVDIQPGLLLGDLYDYLEAAGRDEEGRPLTGSMGACRNVGAGGHALGGGHGALSRAFGLFSDNVLEFQVVTASGRLVTANTTHHADLYWALRGGGSGNFGVVVQMRVQAHRIPPWMTFFRIRVPAASFGSLFQALHAWGPQQPRELGLEVIFKPVTSNTTVEVRGNYMGSYGALLQILATGPLKGLPMYHVGETPFISTITYEPSPKSFTADSDFVFADAEIHPDAVLRILRDFTVASQGRSNGNIHMFMFGGAVSVATHTSAYAHRDKAWVIQYNMNCDRDFPDHGEISSAINAPGLPASELASCRADLGNFVTSVARPAITAMNGGRSGGGYHGYPASTWGANYMEAYYGNSAARLVAVKAVYDPNDVFMYPQGVPVKRHPMKE